MSTHDPQRLTNNQVLPQANLAAMNNTGPMIQSINDLTALNQSLLYHVDEQKRKKLVCVHWIKSRCTRGETCDYLHSLDKEKLPVCKYF